MFLAAFCGVYSTAETGAFDRVMMMVTVSISIVLLISQSPMLCRVRLIKNVKFLPSSVAKP